jgi:hypothetical protein
VKVDRQAIAMTAGVHRDSTLHRGGSRPFDYLFTNLRYARNKFRRRANRFASMKLVAAKDPLLLK